MEVPPVTFRELSSEGGGGESSAVLRARVVAAREIQAAHFRKSANATHFAMGPRQARTHFKLDSESMGYLEHAMQGNEFQRPGK